MWNNRQNATEVEIRHIPVGSPATNSATPGNLPEEASQLTSENLASAAAEENILSAYAALLADNEAFRTRLEREKSRVIEAEKASVAQALLDSTDDVERALASVADVNALRNRELRDLIQGVRLSLALLYKRIADMGAERMSTKGQRFDPQFAEAVGTVSVTDPAQHGIIIDEVRPGYRVGDRLLRPAQVRVGHLVQR
jgi:molecular chaperone GrpE